MSTVTALRVVHEPDPGVDLVAAEKAAAQFLRALGVSLDSESLRGTPGRMARAYAEGILTVGNGMICFLDLDAIFAEDGASWAA